MGTINGDDFFRNLLGSSKQMHYRSKDICVQKAVRKHEKITSERCMELLKNYIIAQ